jgi:hypothetical protein
MAKAKQAKVPVTARALIQRINRKLAATTDQGNWGGKRLRASRGAGDLNNLGDYYVLDLSRNAVVDDHVNPEKFGRDLGVLKEWERVEQ